MSILGSLWLGLNPTVYYCFLFISFVLFLSFFLHLPSFRLSTFMTPFFFSYIDLLAILLCLFAFSDFFKALPPKFYSLDQHHLELVRKVNSWALSKISRVRSSRDGQWTSWSVVCEVPQIILMKLKSEEYCYRFRVYIIGLSRWTPNNNIPLSVLPFPLHIFGCCSYLSFFSIYSKLHDALLVHFFQVSIIFPRD